MNPPRGKLGRERVASHTLGGVFRRVDGGTIGDQRTKPPRLLVAEAYDKTRRCHASFRAGGSLVGDGRGRSRAVLLVPPLCVGGPPGSAGAYRERYPKGCSGVDGTPSVYRFYRSTRCLRAGGTLRAATRLLTRVSGAWNFC